MKKLLVLLLISCTLCLAQEVGARYLIVTHDDFYDAIQPLAQWKHKKGMRTKVVKLSEIGSSSAQIKAYIDSAYNNWLVRPEFLLLVGAPNYLPFVTVSGTYSDNYYANMDGDIYNEILPGRLTVHNATEAQTVVNKILLYERTPDNSDSLWFINACLIVRNDYGPDDTIYWSDIHQAKNFMLQNGYHTIDTLASQFGNSASDVIQSVNDGRAFVLYRGQGVGNWWSPFAVDPDQTQNGKKLPIVLSITCSTISTGPNPDEAERWLLTGTPSTPRGASGFFATTTVVIGQAYLRSAVSKGFFNAIFNDRKRTFGEASEAGRTNVYNLYGSASEYRGFATLGDPEMNIWTAIPKPVEVVYDSSLYVDDESLHVRVNLNSVPVESALVCVVLDTIIYQYGYTSSAGEITFLFDSLIPGQMDLTVTGKNLYPYETEVSIIDTNAYLAYRGYSINDSLANNNGLPEGGETILLRTMIKNIGNTIAYDVLARLRTDDTLVSIIDSTVSFGNMYPQDSSLGISPFVFSISPFCPGDHMVNFELWMHDIAGDTWFGNFSITVNTPAGVIGPDQYGYYIYDDTDTLSGHAPLFSWFEIAPPGPGALVNEITNEDADTVTYSLPFNFKFYGIDYSSIGLCSNGFLEMGYSTYRFGDNGPIPLPGGPKRLLAPFWDDLDPSLYGDIYYYNDAANHRWIIEYENCAHYSNSSSRETFQVVLLDPQYYPTQTGDGEVLYFYSHVADATSNTVGIEDHTESCGLQYVYDNSYNQNAAVLINNRALLVTTKPPVGTVNTPWLYIIDYTISDSLGGNNNGIVEPDETVDIYISIKNSGDTVAYNVMGTLRTTDEDAEVLDSISDFGNVLVGTTGSNIGDPYQVHISANPADSAVGFSLHLECNAGTYHKDDYFTIYLYGLPGVEENQLEQTACFNLEVYPNPCRGMAAIRCQITQGQNGRLATSAHIKIYDISGRLVKEFSHLTNQAVHQLVWDGSDSYNRKVPNGVYFVQLETAENSKIKKIVLLK